MVCTPIREVTPSGYLSVSILVARCASLRPFAQFSIAINNLKEYCLWMAVHGGVPMDTEMAVSGCTNVTPRKFRFTVKDLNRLPKPDQGRLYYYDQVQPGLALCCSANSKRFVAVKKVAGKLERRTLRLWPTVEAQQAAALDDARAEASTLYSAAVNRRNPYQEQREARAAEVRAGKTLRDTFNEYMEWAKKRAKNPMREITVKNFNSMFELHLRPWADRKLSSITDDEVVKLHTSIGETRHYAANRACQLLRAVFNFAIAKPQQYITVNPAAKFPAFPEPPRGVFMSFPQLRIWRTALEQEPNEMFRDFFNLSLFTAARRSNVSSMRFDEIDFEKRQWYIPATKSKNSTEMTVNLSPSSWESCSADWRHRIRSMCSRLPRANAGILRKSNTLGGES